MTERQWIAAMLESLYASEIAGLCPQGSFERALYAALPTHAACIAVASGDERYGDPDYDAALACIDQQPGRLHRVITPDQRVR